MSTSTNPSSPQPEPLPSTAPDGADAPSQSRGRGRGRILIVVGIAAAVFAALVLVAQLTKNRSSESPTAASASANPAPTATAQAASDGGGEQQAPSASPAAGDDGPGLERNDPDDPMAIGDVDAPVTMIEFTDMRCPFCAQFDRDTLPEIQKKYVDSGQLRIEFHDVSFFGPESERAAMAARAAGRQGKYVEYITAVYAAAPARGHPELPDDELVDFAREVGVEDIDRFKKDMKDPALAEEVRASTQQAQMAGVTSVPFFGIGMQGMAGAQPIENFEEFIDKALEDAGEKPAE
ncbi:DsbA family protein [Helcobacillus massiliensis]|uniref:Protein-disulfide isomerase n=1 Tax=Helcobacillus massiliensis TaxID=521392 RepID=A0A839QPJ5_9MICO|nr:protein-disulfide isomerase [Helcobacillus massiliensis]